MIKLCAFSVAAAAGLATAGGAPHQAADGLFVEPASNVVPEEQAGYYYINLGTGEKIFTAAGQVVPRGATSAEVWIADNRLPCAAFGQTGGSSGLIDDADGTGAGALGSTVLHWGDIPQDTVIDAVEVRWSTRHIDVDADGDGSGDGVVGFGCQWSWFDGDNGFNSCLTRTPLVSFTLFNLPGRTAVPPGTALSVYTAVVDLGADFDDSLTFEIGDSDGDTQGAAVHNAFYALGDLDFDGVPDGDLDGDGLADFSYAQRYFQPGTTDFDGDGQPDGDPAAVADCGNSLVAPTGTAIPDPADPTGVDWIIDPVAPLPAGQGIEDRFDRFTDINNDGLWEPFGTFFYGGFSCDEDGDGVPGGNAANTRSFAQMWHIMYGPGGAQPCLPDLFPAGAPDGVLNFFDISRFISLYNAQDPIADFFPSGGGDGVFNFFDISAFVSAYNAGCP
jgi:hypothetical protein